MNSSDVPPLSPEPLDPQLTTIQPGGGFVMRMELAWGYVRRWCLRTFFKSYVARMQQLRKGEENPCPHEVLDPRDLKYYQNQGGFYWEPQDDPFAWRDRIPFARAGLAELLFFAMVTFGPAALVAWQINAQKISGSWLTIWWLVVAALLITGGLIVWFFRDPNRRIPDGEGVVVSPADGKVVQVERVEDNEFMNGPAVQIGIFLSIFNVHMNRVPMRSRIIQLIYRPGKFLNALLPQSAQENEQLEVRLQGPAPAHRRMIVRQIAGAIARRIVCWSKPGDELGTGERFGMIKLGSRTELLIPDEPELEIVVKPGDTVHAGSTVMARYRDGSSNS
ncbi:phosphatidylserine decarboxylase [Maioricimonas rarisocia]|uniref:Phosphatidylserine decarboxylase proenzyme n=1 Tax=Maioricimonas rarisocia TaxID=2528026 RepID=A0A517ZA02_9PLAN|nr:phosphatidylserine decarboxylase family protein [Maioricimonas rarisocia]QDU39316.1 phosphatidylserine decarboxylase [Maioricimonas rarisocia]